MSLLVLLLLLILLLFVWFQRVQEGGDRDCSYGRVVSKENYPFDSVLLFCYSWPNAWTVPVTTRQRSMAYTIDRTRHGWPKKVLGWRTRRMMPTMNREVTCQEQFSRRRYVWTFGMIGLVHEGKGAKLKSSTCFRFCFCLLTCCGRRRLIVDVAGSRPLPFAMVTCIEPLETRTSVSHIHLLVTWL